MTDVYDSSTVLSVAHVLTPRRSPINSTDAATRAATATPAPKIEHVAPASAVTDTAPTPLIEYVAPAPAVTYGTPAPVIEDVAPAPAVTCAAPAPETNYVTHSPVMQYIAPAATFFPSLVNYCLLPTPWNPSRLWQS